MPAPKNVLKEKLLKGETQLGLWLGLADMTASYIAAGAGFDWVLIDQEHGPNTQSSTLTQLMAMEGQGASVVVRTPSSEDWMIKHALDLGAQTLLIPLIETPEQAAQVAAASRYAPEGRRGVGAALARASRFNAIPDYPQTANAEVCVIVQVESKLGLENLREIAETPGIDGVFIGPADLSADMGYLGQPEAPEVVNAIEAAIKLIRACRKVAGIVVFDADSVARYADLGVGFLGVGSDVTTLAGALRSLAKESRKRAR